jgi:hypothetical protein
VLPLKKIKDVLDYTIKPWFWATFEEPRLRKAISKPQKDKEDGKEKD